MASGRRCCCCRDVYYWNDGAFERLHIPIPVGNTAVPFLKERVANGIYQDFKVDYRNKKIVTVALSETTVIGGIVFKQPTLFISSNLHVETPPNDSVNWTNLTKVIKMQGITDPGISGPGRITSVNGLALDWKNKRIFYVVCDQTFTDTHANTIPIYGIRCVNYDGTDEHLVVLEDKIAGIPPPANANTFFHARQFQRNTLTYNVDNDTLYYVTLEGINAGVGAGSVHYDIRSVKSDGTGQTTVVNIDGILSPDTPTAINFQPFLAGGAFNFSSNKFVLAQLDVASDTPPIPGKLTVVDLSTGALSVIISLTNLGPFTGFRRVFYPKFCTQDGLIYFFSQSSNPTLSETSGLKSIKWDGTQEKEIFNFGNQPNASPPLFWVGTNFSPFQVILLGCGMELTGEKYKGPNG